MAIGTAEPITLDINGRREYEQKTTKQFNKNSRSFEITFTDQGALFEIPSGTIARVKAIRRDKHEIYEDLPLPINNKVLLELTEEMQMVSGEMLVEVILSNEGRLGSGTFPVMVEASVHNSETITTSPTYSTFENALDRVDGWDAQFETKYNGLEEEYASQLATIATIKPSGGDDSIIINNALVTNGTIHLQKNASYKITNQINLDNHFIYGNNATIECWGCDGLVIKPEWCGGANDLTLLSLSDSGEYYPKLNTGIKLNGIGAAPLAVNNGTFDNIKLIGWDICVDMRFAWSGRYSNINTLSCNICFQTYGQSVNNTISDSKLLTDTIGQEKCFNLATASGMYGEGLVITNSLIASANNAFVVSDFLSLNISNCIIDLIRGVAFMLTNAKGLCITNSWVYSNSDFIFSNNLGDVGIQHNIVTGNNITSTNGPNCIFIGSNNSDWSIQANNITCKNSALYLELSSKDILFGGNVILQSNPTGASITNYGTNNHITNNAGDASLTIFENALSHFNIAQNNASDYGRCVGSYAFPPVGGSYKKGDFVINNQFSTSNFFGYVCTADGSPGVWVPFGWIYSQQTANPDTTGSTLLQLEAEVNQLKAIMRTSGILAT